MILNLAKSGTIISNDEFLLEIVDSNSQTENPLISSIDLGECETRIKIKHGISLDQSLLILKVDLIRNSSSPQVEYKVYDKEGKELSLESCKDLKIGISYPVNSCLIVIII